MQQTGLRINMTHNRSGVDGSRTQRVFRFATQCDVRGKRGIEGIAGTRRSGNLGLQDRTEKNGVLGTEEGTVAAVRDDYEARAHSPKGREESGQGHIVTATGKAAGKQARRGLAGR